MSHLLRSVTLSAALFSAAMLSAQGIGDFFGNFFQNPRPVESSGREGAKFVYDVNFNYAFVNNEFDASDGYFVPSGTIAAARLTPYIGFEINRGAFGSHRLMAGIDVLKNFGANPISYGAENDPSLENKALLREVTLWYQYARKFGKTDFFAAAGVFPRQLCRGKYTTAVFSDGVRFFDNNAEGLMLRWKRPRSNYEVILDWNGLYGTDRREQFNVLTYGECYLSEHLYLGWQGMFHHYANSANVGGVVDDHLLNPFVAYDFTKSVPVEVLTVSAGAYLGYQRDRRKGKEYKTPLGGSLVTDVRNWRVGLRNELYYGADLMPLFNDTDNAGIMYGANLYFRSGSWKISKDGKPGFYDNAELYWRPLISEFVDIKISAIAHFLPGFIGWQQLVILNFDLEKIGRQPATAKKQRREQERRPQNYYL